MEKLNRRLRGAPLLGALIFLGFEAFVMPTAAPKAAPKVPMRVKVFDFPFLNNQDEEPGRQSSGDAEDASRVVEVSMPLGIDFEERDGGDIYIKAVDKSSDAYAQGVRPGAQLVMISATFGDEMWNTRNVGLTQFFTVLNSRFGSTMKLALEKEDQNVLAAFMDAFAPAAKVEEIDEQKQKDLMAEFDQEEEKLKNSPGLWNPFG